MLGKILITRAATHSSSGAGTERKRQPEICGSGPGSERCIQSMTRRKQTTARPEKIPINTDRIRKTNSSLKSPSRVENRRRGAWNRTGEEFAEDAGWLIDR